MVVVESFGSPPTPAHPHDAYVEPTLGVVITKLRVPYDRGQRIETFVVTASSDDPESRRHVREIRVNLLALRSAADLLRTVAMLAWGGSAWSTFALPGSEAHVRFEQVLVAVVAAIDGARMSGSADARDLSSVAYAARETFSNLDLDVLRSRVLGSHPDVHEALGRLAQVESDRARADVVLSSFTAGRPQVLSVGRLHVENKYNIQANQIGAVGDHASGGDLSLTNQQLVIGTKSLDAFDLVADLRRLSLALSTSAQQGDELVERAVTELHVAEQAARAGNSEGLREALSRTGAWVLRVAEGIGVPVAIAAIQEAIGLK